MTEELAPSNITAERGILGAVMVDSQHLTTALSVGLRPQHFYREAHGLVFKAMIECDDAGVAIDEITVSDVLQRSGAMAQVGVGEVEQLAGHVPAAGHAREYATLVRDLAQRRGLIAASHVIREAAIKGDQSLIDIVSMAEREIDEVVLDLPSGDLDRLPFEQELDRAERVMTGSVDPGMTSGYKDLDGLIGGWQDEALIVIAARPSMGKSAIVTNMAEAALRTGAPVAMFSLEMSRSEILRRMLACNARVHGDALLRGPLTEKQLDRVRKANEQIAKWALYVDEGVDAGVYDIRARARRLHARLPYGLGLVIVDYLQLMRQENPRGNRVQEIGLMTRGLKTLAKELGVPVIALSQLSRQLEQRSDKRPQLSDLRESGAIEQDADMVLFLHRPGYYDKDVDPSETELSVAKHRNGRIGIVDLTFIPEFPKFVPVSKLGDVDESSESSIPF